jgi:hypothetical protein
LIAKTRVEVNGERFQMVNGREGRAIKVGGQSRMVPRSLSHARPRREAYLAFRQPRDRSVCPHLFAGGGVVTASTHLSERVESATRDPIL